MGTKCLKAIMVSIILLSAVSLMSCTSATSLTTSKTTPLEQPTTTLPSTTTTSTISNSTETVVLNYGEHKSVTYQQIKDKLVYYFNRDIQWSKEDGFEYQLKEITIENYQIIIFLELHFQPSSKAWLIHDAYSWLWLATFTGLDIDGENAGTVYNTGYEISVIMSTPLSDGNIISWGTAKIKDSGKPFDDNTFNRDRIWIDGAGMTLLD